MADFLIHDSTPEHKFTPPDRARGLDLSRRPFGANVYGTAASPFPTSLLIPRSEWQARIEEMEATKTSIPALCDQAGLKVKDQQQTEFCWANGPTHCVEVVRTIEGQKPIVLSAASVACRVNGFVNRGGWGGDALDFIIEHGIVPADQWPNTAINRQYLTDANVQLALKYRVTEWWELAPKNLDQLVTCLLLRIPVAVGYSWWGHEVTAVKPLWLDGTVALEIDNSWGTSWGDNGRGTIQGSRMQPDDAVCPRVTLAA